MNIFKRTNAKREADAGLTSKEAPKEQPKEAPKETPKDRPKRTMTQAEFSGYAKGGVVKGRGDGCAVKGKTKGRMV